MNRIIINNRSKLDDRTVLDMVHSVVRNGKVSNDGKQYCYLITFVNGHAVSCSLTRTGQTRFDVWKRPKRKPKATRA